MRLPEHGTTIERAKVLVTMQRFDEAVALLNTVTATNPEDGEAWCLLAQSHIGRRDPTAALTAARWAAARSPDSSWPQRLISISERRLGRPKAAVEAARSATRLAPYEWQSHLTLADALIAQGRAGEAAVHAAETAARLAPHESEAHLAVSRALYASGLYALAQTSAAEGVRLNPQSSAAHNELARTRLRQAHGPGALARAARQFATAVRGDPRFHIGRRNFQLTVRLFFGRTIFLLAMLMPLVWFADAERGPGSQWMPGIAVGVIATMTWRFVHSLGFEGRHAAWMYVRRDRLLATSAVLVTASLVSLAGWYVIPRPHGGGHHPVVWVASACTVIAIHVIAAAGRPNGPHDASVNRPWER